MSIAFTAKTLAERWQTKPETIRRMIRAGRLKAFSLGVGDREFRISHEVVTQWESAQRAASDQQSTDTASAASGSITSPTIGRMAAAAARG